MPKLWTFKRLASIAILLAIGLFQAMAAIAAALAAVRFLTEPEAADGVMIGIVFGGAITVVALRILQRRLAEQFALAYVKELRLALMSHVLRMPVDGDTLRFGLVMTRVVNDFSSVRLWLASGLVATLVAGSVLGTLCLYLALTQMSALAALIPALGLWLGILLIFWEPLNRQVVESRRRRGRIAATAGSILNGRVTYLAFGRHGQLMRKLSRQTDKMNRALIARATLSGLLRSHSDLVLPVTAVCLGLATAGGGASDPETLGLMILVTGIVITQLNAVAMAVEYRLANNIAVARLKTIFDRPTMALSSGTNRLKRTGRGRSLDLDGLVMPGGSDISFKVKAGDQAQLTGLSAEETRVVFLRIAGLSDDPSGAVCLDGAPSTTFSRRDWWRSVCLVSRSLPSISGTLLNSVALGNHSRIAAGERERICRRLGLTPAILDQNMREGDHPAIQTAAAIRAVRCLLRGASVVLVDDPDLLGNREQLGSFLEELALLGTTVLLSEEGLGTTVRDTIRTVPVCRSARRAA
ncbi:MAG: ABC transporter ATP-binding protein/permease [Alphaproteobacteria bacterium]|nr:ABC transporter ATP-binding protein/permease [Alphaproteobacteria bacterium]